MECIDAFCHIFPTRFFEMMVKAMGDTSALAKRMKATPTIYDLEARFRVMDEFEGYSQILSLGLPGIEAMADENTSPEFARIANDGLAELVSKHPDRFAGYVGGLPMNAPEAAVREAERILLRGNANGLQIHTTVNGRCLDDPRFLPIFEVAAASGKPILLHPSRTGGFPDFPAEDHSRYEIWTVFGWPFETSVTMARLVFSGIMSRFPSIKIVTHHFGAMIPLFESRMSLAWASLGTRGGPEDYSEIIKRLGKPLIECFRDFYADTALSGGKAGTVCGLDFFGVDHSLFATDAPFGPEGGRAFIRLTIDVLESLDISTADKSKIFKDNARSLFKL